MKTIYKLILLALLVFLPIIAGICGQYGLNIIARGVSCSFLVTLLISLLCYLGGIFSK